MTDSLWYNRTEPQADEQESPAPEEAPLTLVEQLQLGESQQINNDMTGAEKFWFYTVDTALIGGPLGILEWLLSKLLDRKPKDQA